jgi:hypothetical protein
MGNEPSMSPDEYHAMLAREGGLAISVVAGGWSVNEVNLNAIPGYVIGVNDSAYRLPRVNAVVSMDRLWAENRKDFILNCGKPVFLRDVATRDPDLRSAKNVRMYQCDNEKVSFGPTPWCMNGTNSAAIGLNLAYIFWPRKLYLFGFDMCRGPKDEAHWHPDYPWNPKSTKQGKLKEWGTQFRSIAEEFKRKRIDVINVSSRSRIEVFQRVSPADLGMERKAS